MKTNLRQQLFAAIIATWTEAAEWHERRVAEIPAARKDSSNLGDLYPLGLRTGHLESAAYCRAMARELAKEFDGDEIAKEQVH